MTRDEQIDQGRQAMREAFVRLLQLAERRSVDAQQLRQLQWQFFDGNQAINEALSR